MKPACLEGKALRKREWTRNFHSRLQFRGRSENKWQAFRTRLRWKRSQCTILVLKTVQLEERETVLDHLLTPNERTDTHQKADGIMQHCRQGGRRRKKRRRRERRRGRPRGAQGL